MIDRLRALYNHLPISLRNAILVRRRTPVWLRAGIVFVHVPRVAGTSMNHALYGRFMGHASACDIRRWGSAALNVLPSFAITRNPWERLVSAYRFAKRGGGVGGAFEAGIFSPQRYQGKEFDTFEVFVKEWLLRQDRAKLDGVFQAQSFFVAGPEGELLVDHIGRLDRLEETIDFVQAILGKPLEVSQGNLSGEHVQFRKYYTPELVDLVGDFYREDICRFGYTFDWS